MAITLRQLKARVDVEGLRKFEADLNQSVSAARRWGDGIRKAVKLAAGALAVAEAAMNGVVAITASAADSTLRLARNLGLTTRQLTAYRIAARIAGTSIEALLDAQRTLEQNVQGLVQGNAVLAQTFFALGIRVTDVNGQFLPLNQIFGQALRSLSAIPDPATRAAAAFRLFGTEADSVLSIIDLGPRRVDELALAADRLGITLDTRAAMGARELTLNLRLLREIVLGIGRTIAVKMAPVLNDTVVLILRWIAANQRLINTGLTRWLPIAVRGFRFLRAELFRGIAAVFRFARDAIPAAGAALLDTAKVTVPMALSLIEDAFAEAWPKLIAGWQAVVSKISPFVGFSPSMVENFQTGLQVIRGFFEAFVVFLPGMAGRIAAAGLIASQLLLSAFSSLIAIAQAFWQTHGPAVETVANSLFEISRAVGAEIRNTVVPAIASMIASAGQVAGQIGGAVFETLAGWIDKLKDVALEHKAVSAAIGAVGIVAGLVAATGIEGLIGSLARLVSTIGIVVLSIAGFTKAFALMLGALLTIPITVGLVVFAFEKWILGIETTTAALDALDVGLKTLAIVVVGKALATVVELFKIWAGWAKFLALTALPAAKTAVVALWAVVAANPIGALITVVVAALVALLGFTQKGRALLAGFWNWMVTAWDFTIDRIADVLLHLVDQFTKAWQGIVDGWRWLVSKVNPWAQASPSMIENMQTGLDAITREFNTAFDDVVNSWETTVGGMQGTLTEFSEGKFQEAADAIRARMSAAFQGIELDFEELKGKLDAGLQVGRSRLETAGRVARAAATKVLDPLSGLRRRAGKGFVSAAGGGLFTGISASAEIENALRDLLSQLDEGTPLFDRFNAKFSQLVQLARDLGQASPDQVLGIQKQFDAILDTIQKPGGFVAGLQAARSKLSEVAESVDPSGRLQQRLDGLIDKLLRATPDAFERARKALERFLNRLKRAALRGDDGSGSGGRDPFTNFGPNVFVQMQQAMQLPFLIGRQLTAFSQQFAIGVNAFTRGTLRFDQANDLLLRELGVLAQRDRFGNLRGFSTDLPLFFTTVSSISHTRLGPGQGISDIPIGSSTSQTITQNISNSFPNAQIDANAIRSIAREVERQLRAAGRLQTNDQTLRLKRE